MRSQTPGLSEQLCFDLYAASRAVTQAYRPALTELGVTYPQYLVLVVLWERGASTIGELGKELHLDYGTLTPLVRRMELNGLVVRRRAGGDARSVLLELTDAAEAMRPEAVRIHCAMVEALGLTEDQFAQLQATLRLVTSRVTG